VCGRNTGCKIHKSRYLAIVRENCSHLSATKREKLLSMLLKHKPLFNGTLGDWNLLPVSFEIKEDMKPIMAGLIPSCKYIKQYS
jgi:hypothetical protein